MKNNQTKYIDDILKVLKSLGKTYPNQPLSTHLAIAFSEYPSFDGISNKEFYYLIEKYSCEKELDMLVPHSNSIEEIIEDGMHLSLDDGEEEDY